MPHWRKVVSKDSKHLSHWDLEGVSPLKVAISAMDEGEVYSQEDGTGVMLFAHFKGAKKALGLCATNCAIIEAITGTSDYTKWVGAKVTLRCAECKGTLCVRIESPQGHKLDRRYPKFRYTDSAASRGKPANATPPPAEPPQADDYDPETDQPPPSMTDEDMDDLPL